MGRPLIVRTLLLSLLVLPISHSATESAVCGQTASGTDIYAEERQRGIELYREKKFSEAAKLLQKLTRKNRADADAFYYLGLALLHNPKEIKAASKAFETALKVRPNFATAHAALSYSLLLRNKLSDALHEAEAALALDPNIPDAHYVVGVARLRAGRKEEALEQAEALIKLNPQFAPAYLLKSQALASYFGDVIFLRENESVDARKGRFSQAADALEKYLQLHPNGEDRQTWIEQLESLRFYVASHRTDKDNARVFSAKDVTTKARVLSKPEPAYTEAARQSGVTGTVVLRAVFAADGAIKHFLVVNALPYGLTEASIKAARKIKFAPATVNGRPVSMFIQLEYNFNLY